MHFSHSQGLLACAFSSGYAPLKRADGIEKECHPRLALTGKKTDSQTDDRSLFPLKQKYP
jgi:hypothetical protein